MGTPNSLHLSAVIDRVAPATPEKRRRGKSMSRRSGQNGYIEVRGKYYVVRFWKDVSGQEKRIHASTRICPISGPGRLTKPERERRAKQIVAESGANSESHFNAFVANETSTTFREQAQWWLRHVQMRKRKPVAPATAEAWHNCLTAWLNPQIGDTPLVSVNNLVMRDLVSTMAARGLSPKTIRNYTQVVKMVVASAVNDEGEQVFPRRWNHEFCDMPEVKNQRTPSFTSEVMSQIVSKSHGVKRMLYALMGATGLRAGEALGIDLQHLQDGMQTTPQDVCLTEEAARFRLKKQAGFPVSDKIPEHFRKW